MKTLTTLTAVAALIAGISIASAQNPASQSPQASPSDMNKSNMPKASGSQTPATTGQSSSGSSMNKQTATGTGKFCVEVSKGGSLNCKFASMDACQKEAKAQGLNCSPNPNSGTTGAK
ncbi:MAG: hypothetical protein HY244_18095 [Rhizobiales bacterium]|nr:hypothetical protein [Hyphomicrobiales bacterium]